MMLLSYNNHNCIDIDKIISMDIKHEEYNCGFKENPTELNLYINDKVFVSGCSSYDRRKNLENILLKIVELQYLLKSNQNEKLLFCFTKYFKIKYDEENNNFILIQVDYDGKEIEFAKENLKL